MTDFYERSLIVHEHLRGKLAVVGKMPICNREDLSTAYTPGVASPCKAIVKNPARARDLTIKHNSIAVVTDGSAVLGLGNIGALAAIPVMEGKALLFKQYADLDAWPICLDTQDAAEIVQTVRRIAPVFGGINLEDIAAPRCFEIEHQLLDLGIPVFHDDQHGTAIVVWAALINAGRVLGLELRDMRVVISGAGAAGLAVARLLRCADGCDPGQRRTGAKDIIVCDSRGIIHQGREDLPPHKQSLLGATNRQDRRGGLEDALEGADVFVGVSRPGLLAARDIARMGRRKIVLALANPEPEIMPGEAVAGGAQIVCTGRSDFPNQVNNVLVFPGIFRGALDAGAPMIDAKMKRAAAHALADAVRNPAPDRILPDVLDRTVAPAVARAVRHAWAQDTP